MCRGYVPDSPYVRLKWESQTSRIMVGMRSQDGGCSHSKCEKGVHVSLCMTLVGKANIPGPPIGTSKVQIG